MKRTRTALTHCGSRSWKWYHWDAIKTSFATH